ncbi:MAG: hypothetical protein DRI65_05840 [Chloroflexota bacterium]|nr:MAG: hypothetical protein DRI65_05840 [Chloroflexota bacterium]
MEEYSKGLRITFLIHSIMMAGFAVIYLFIPVLWGDLTGCLSNLVPQVFRLFGTAILGFAISSFLAYRESEWGSVKIPAQLNCLISILFTIVLILGISFWDLPSIAWMYLAVMFGFAVVFNYFYFKK